MSLRPVDAQTAITRTQDVSREQQIRDGEPGVNKQAFAAHLKEKAERAEREVEQSSDTSGPQIRGEDQTGRQSETDDRAGSGRRHHRQMKSAKAAPSEPGKGTRLDVKL